MAILQLSREEPSCGALQHFNKSVYFGTGWLLSSTVLHEVTLRMFCKLSVVEPQALVASRPKCMSFSRAKVMWEFWHFWYPITCWSLLFGVGSFGSWTFDIQTSCTILLPFGNTTKCFLLSRLLYSRLHISGLCSFLLLMLWNNNLLSRCLCSFAVSSVVILCFIFFCSPLIGQQFFSYCETSPHLFFSI